MVDNCHSGLLADDHFHHGNGVKMYNKNPWNNAMFHKRSDNWNRWFITVIYHFAKKRSHRKGFYSREVKKFRSSKNGRFSNDRP